MDQPTAAQLQDLKQRGMLEDTLVISAGEFGRTATAEGKPERLGRGHHADAFSLWMAGGGVRGGLLVGQTNELGAKAVENRVLVHDLHATVLHLLGHQRPTYSAGILKCPVAELVRVRASEVSRLRLRKKQIDFGITKRSIPCPNMSHRGTMTPRCESCS